MRLTTEQEAIADHDYGTARVFAVAGAGKTTAMVHRIHRLVQKQVFAPQRILASSFSRGTVASLTAALTQWPDCRSVKPRTLHSLGFQVIQRAREWGYLPAPASPLSPGEVDGQLYQLALRQVRQQNLYFKDELDTLDQDDFLAYVSTCKGRLQYADLGQVAFPDMAPHRGIAQQAIPPSEDEVGWYLDLYQLFEAIRHHQGWISFDDMLMTGWQLLVQYPELLEQVQQQFDCVMVDEFQDINRAQFGILDLLTRPHRNYMVIGDDDQTIYEWRGAEVRFMLKEFDRYQPTTYQMTDNFRCQASQVVLANAVIRHNRNRYVKQLHLTQGFEGCTQIHPALDGEQQGRAVVQQVETALTAGVRPCDIAILVRVYAQTPYVEQHLIKANIPYWGADLVPFYRRPEILNFLAFAHLAQWDAEPSTALGYGSERKQTWEADWHRIKLLPPLRYLSKDLKAQIQERVGAGRESLSQVLLSIQAAVPQERMARTLVALAHWLAIAPTQASARATLEQLDGAIGYRDYLKHRSGAKQTGLGKVAGVDAIITYAADKGSLPAFLAHLIQLQQQAELHTQNADQCVRLTTIHQSKGLEWAVVLVPHCNVGILPFGDDLSPGELEEERRLMYVAITRAKRELHLYAVKSQPQSPFLQEAQAANLLQQINQLQAILTTDPAQWQARDVVNLLQCITRLGLERYFRQWWMGSAADHRAIAATIHHFLLVAQPHQRWADWGIDPAQVELWRAIAPPPPSPVSPFPGWEAWVAAAEPPRSHRGRSPGTVGLSHRNSFHPKDRVEHGKFGRGVVKTVEQRPERGEELVTVDFPAYGTKRILITEKFCTLHRISS